MDFVLTIIQPIGIALWIAIPFSIGWIGGNYLRSKLDAHVFAKKSPPKEKRKNTYFLGDDGELIPFTDEKQLREYWRE